MNRAIREGRISAPIVLGRDHHDVSGTDSPYRETSNIYDGSQFTADMAVQNVIGDSFRGATWVSLHNRMMLHWDVNNGIARRSWARNKGAMFAIKREMERTPELKVTMPYLVDESLL